MVSGVRLLCGRCSCNRMLTVSVISGSSVLVRCLSIVVIGVGGVLGTSASVMTSVTNGGKLMTSCSAVLGEGLLLVLMWVRTVTLVEDTTTNALNRLQIIVRGSVLGLSNVLISGQLRNEAPLSVMVSISS